MNKSSARAENNFKSLLPLIFCLLTIAVYAAYPTVNYYWDGIIYAQFIEDVSGFGAQLFHPNHLFYNFLGYTVYQAAQTLGLQTRALFVLQFTTIVFGGLCAAVFFTIAKSAFRTNYLSASLTAIFAFSAAWWRFATDADVYVVSIFFLLVGFFLILPEQPPRPLAVAAAHAFGMFFHQLAVLFFPAVIVGLLFQTAMFDKRKRASVILRYCAAVFALTFGTYCLSFYLLTGEFDLNNFFAWTLSHAEAAGFHTDVFENTRLSLRGNRQLLVDGSSNLFKRGFINFFLLFVFASAAIVFLVKCGRNLREVKIFLKEIAGQKIHRQRVAILCAAWTIPYLIFLFFFTPENLFYRLFYFPALVVFIGVVFSAYENANRTRRRRVALLTLMFALYNFLFYIQPNSLVEINEPLALALRAKAVWSDKSVVFYDSSARDDSRETSNRLIKYFNPSVAWQPIDSITLEEFENKISEINADGGTVWLESTAVKRLSANPQTARWLTDNSIEKANSQLSLPKYDIRFVEIVPKSFGTDDSTINKGK